MPQEPVTAKALWTPATATYHYAYFIQDPNNPSNYNYVTTTAASGTVGTMTATAPVQPNTGVFRFEHTATRAIQPLLQQMAPPLLTFTTTLQLSPSTCVQREMAPFLQR